MFSFSKQTAHQTNSDKSGSFPQPSALPQTSKLSRSVLTRLIVGGTTLVVGAAAYFSYQIVRNATLENLKQNALLKVNNGVNEIDQWIALRLSETEAIANAPITQTMDWATIAPYFKSEHQRLNSFEPLLGIIDQKGQFFNLLKGRTNVNLSDRLHFKRGMAGQSTIMDPMISRVNGKRIIVFAAPIWSGLTQDRSRKPVGVINAPVGIEKITAVVRDLKYGSGSYAFALNSKGEAITHPNTVFMSTLEKPAPSLTQSEDQGLAQVARWMVDRQQGIELVTLNGKQQYVAFLPLKEANWSVALVIPQAEIEAQLQLLDGIAAVIFALAGTLIGVLVYVQSTEQSQLKKSKLAADAANQAKSEFLANMSHELRTPLNGILGYAQILSRSKTWGEKEQRGIHIIHQCGAHLLTLINDVLDLSKIEARRLELTPTAFYFPSFLQSVVEMCQVRAEQKGLTFEHHCDPQLPSGIEADEKRLRQVLLNLMGNAIKFTDHGSVTFTVERLEPSPPGTVRIQFTIADTGVGIAPENLEKLFQAFEQVGERNRKAEGTGLGLAISQQIIQLMGSRIQVKSQPNVGSDFFFEVTLPQATDWSQQQTVEVGNIIGYEGTQRHLLVVDDRWENRAVLINLLEPLGFVITEAENGQQGLERMRQQRPDLVISDLAMPVMDGFTMLREIRNDETLRSLTVIVSSASVAQMDQQMSLDAGGDDFLAKPVQMQDLLRLLETALHLTWKYEDNPTPPAEQSSSVGLVSPPTMELQTWLELVQEGRLKKLMTTAEEFEQRQPEYQPFTRQVIQMARQFQSEQLESFIQSHLPQ